MSQNKGCLGNLIFFCLMGSLLFGGFRCSLGGSGFEIGFGSNYHREQWTNLTLLEKQKTTAEEAVKLFYSQLNQQKCDTINQQTGQAFRQYIRQSGENNWCEKLYQLGKVQSSELVNWTGDSARNRLNDSDCYILLFYKVKYEHLPSPVETVFTWRVYNQTAELYGYSINANPINPSTPTQSL